jgi:hypothetical protein
VFPQLACFCMWYGILRERSDLPVFPLCSASLDSLLSSSHCFLHSTSAEAVAMGLLKQFEGMQLPAASELEWLVPEHDAPQKVGSPVFSAQEAVSPFDLFCFLT